MAKKIVYSKGFDGVSDFVYVDLLPDVKRSRQFNMNVIITLTFAVVMSFVLIYIPFRAVTEEFELVNGINNDKKHQLLLTNEELIGYEINLETIEFETQIDKLEQSKVDFIDLFYDIKQLVRSKNINFTTTLEKVTYNSSTNTFDIMVESTSKDLFNHLNNDFLDLDWVPDQLSNIVLWQSVFTIGVDNDVE